MRKEIDSRLSSGFSSNSGSPFLAHQGSTKPKKSGNKQVPEGRGLPKDDDNFFKSESKRRKISKASSSTKNANDGEILQDEKLSTIKNEKKRRRKMGCQNLWTRS